MEKRFPGLILSVEAHGEADGGVGSGRGAPTRMGLLIHEPPLGALPSGAPSTRGRIMSHGEERRQIVLSPFDRARYGTTPLPPLGPVLLTQERNLK